MKIGLNGQHILINDPAGPERFTLNLYKALANLDHSNTYVLYLNKAPKEQFLSEYFRNSPNFKFKIINSSVMWTQFWLALELWLHPVDVFFSARHTLPILKPLKTKYIVMIHGLEYLTNQKFGKYSALKIWHGLLLKIVAKIADKIVVPSISTYNALKNNGVSISKVTVINEGVDNLFKQRSDKEVAQVIQKYDLKFQKYLLFVSTIQPRKNVVRLIDSFSRLLHASENYKDYQLVLVGKLGWNYMEIINAPKKLDVENSVKFLNWVSQEDLYSLFSAAKGYVNFSVDEGFGLTVLEAMASEIPVAVSDIPAHRGVANDCVLFANPNNVDDIVKVIETVLNGTYNKEFIKKAKVKSVEYTWEKTADKLIKLFGN